KNKKKTKHKTKVTYECVETDIVLACAVPTSQTKEANGNAGKYTVRRGGLCEDRGALDEFSRSSLSNCCIELLKNVSVSDDLVPVVMKLLRAQIHGESDEDEFIRLVVETVDDIRDPLGEAAEMEEDMRQRDRLMEQLEQLTNDKQHLEQSLQRIKNHKGSQWSQLNAKLQETEEQIQQVNEQLTRKEEKDVAIWQRVICIASDLFEFTRKDWKHHLIQPLCNSVVAQALFHDLEVVRVSAIKAFTLFCCLDKRIAEKNIQLFFNVMCTLFYSLLFDLFDFKRIACLVWCTRPQALRNDDFPQESLIAMKALFDFLLIYDLFSEQEMQIDKHEHEHDMKLDEHNDGSGDEKSQPPNTINSAKEIVEILKDYLQSSDQNLLNCATEGFCKLLFLNRLKYYSTEILTQLFLLFHNPAIKSDETDQICQTLSVFWSKFCDYNIFPANRQLIVSCLMPCIRSIAYAAKDSPLRGVSLSNVVDHFLWLLGAGADSCMPVQDKLNGKKGDNIKKYKILTWQAQSALATNHDKVAKKWMDKFKEKLDAADDKPDIKLNQDELGPLNTLRQQRIQHIVTQHLEFMDDEDERLAFIRERQSREADLSLSDYENSVNEAKMRPQTIDTNNNAEDDLEPIDDNSSICSDSHTSKSKSARQRGTANSGSSHQKKQRKATNPNDGKQSKASTGKSAKQKTKRLSPNKTKQKSLLLFFLKLFYAFFVLLYQKKTETSNNKPNKRNGYDNDEKVSSDIEMIDRHQIDDKENQPKKKKKKQKRGDRKNKVMRICMVCHFFICSLIKHFNAFCLLGCVVSETNSAKHRQIADDEVLSENENNKKHENSRQKSVGSNAYLRPNAKAVLKKKDLNSKYQTPEATKSNDINSLFHDSSTVKKLLKDELNSPFIDDKLIEGHMKKMQSEKMRMEWDKIVDALLEED
ncbi:hypothetical protein RFI_00881, partial [Reticulomyxa filosa]